MTVREPLGSRSVTAELAIGLPAVVLLWSRCSRSRRRPSRRRGAPTPHGRGPGGRPRGAGPGGRDDGSAAGRCGRVDLGVACRGVGDRRGVVAGRVGVVGRFRAARPSDRGGSGGAVTVWRHRVAGRRSDRGSGTVLLLALVAVALVVADPARAAGLRAARRAARRRRPTSARSPGRHGCWRGGRATPARRPRRSSAATERSSRRARTRVPGWPRCGSSCGVLPDPRRRPLGPVRRRPAGDQLSRWSATDRPESSGRASSTSPRATSSPGPGIARLRGRPHVEHVVLPVSAPPGTASFAPGSAEVTAVIMDENTLTQYAERRTHGEGDLDVPPHRLTDARRPGPDRP